MLDNMFPFIDRATSFIIQQQAFFDFLQKTGLNKKVKSSSDETEIEVPLDIVLSLLRPDELEKLRNYITFYLTK